MDATPRALLRNWIPQLPSIVKTALLAALRRSPNAEHQPWLTEVLIKMAQPILRTPTSLLASQEHFNRDPGVKGPVWVAKYTVPAPLQDGDHGAIDVSSLASGTVLTVAEAMSFAINTLSTYPEEKLCPIPDFDPSGVEVEWTSYRSNANKRTRLPTDLSQRDIYALALQDIPEGEESPVILHTHGGAFCLMDPATKRSNASNLARDTDSRVVAVRYRLSPQNIFPAAVMDMFLAYLALICPPPGAFHRPVPGHKIVLEGDSSGANLVASLQILLVTLLQQGRNKIRNPWTRDAEDDCITIPDPPTAALSLSSPWLDITRSLPSTSLNGKYDFIAPAPMLTDTLMSTSPLFPPDSIWPTDPIRTETYCEATMCAHPLVTPLMAGKGVLKDFPATYVCVGWEGMTDESEVLCRRIHEAKSEVQKEEAYEPSELNRTSHEFGDGTASNIGVESEDQSRVSVDSSTTLISEEQITRSNFGLIFDGYTAMPHIFTAIPFNSAAKTAKQRRASHIKRAVLTATEIACPSNVPRNGCERISDRASWTNSKRLTEVQMSFSDLAMSTGRDPNYGYERQRALTDEYVEQLIRQGRDFRVKLEAKLRTQAAQQIHDNPAVVFSQYEAPQPLTGVGTWLWMRIVRFRDFALRASR